MLEGYFGGWKNAGGSRFFPTSRVLCGGLFCLLLTGGLPSFQAQAQTAEGFTGLGSLPMGEKHPNSYAYGVSADGSVVVGQSNGKAFFWTAHGGMEALSGVSSVATAANTDGSVIVGYGQKGFSTRAYRWTRDGSVEDLGSLEGTSTTYAYGVSGDGSIIVGASGRRAFRWTHAGGMEDLGFILGKRVDFVRATAISTDGMAIVGTHSSGKISEAFRWTRTEGMRGLGFLPETRWSRATAVNANGTVIVGESGDDAFRWTESTGMISLGRMKTRDSYSHSYRAQAVSADGSVIVGYGSAEELFGVAFRWTERTGMQLVSDWLAENGIAVDNWRLERANGISADGTVIVGTGYNLAIRRREAWMARAGGLIGVEEFTTTLAGVSSVGTAVMGTMDTLLHGLHGRPATRRRGAPGWCAWASGDIGRNTHGEDDGGFGLGEFGLCYRDAETFYVGFGIAYSHFSQDLAYGGRMYSDGAILSLEGQLKLAEAAGAPLWLVTTGTAGLSGMEIERGYLNGGTIDSSRGDTSHYSLGLSGRLEWENALRLSENAAVSPHVKATVLHARIDGYSESGGGFPAVFSAMKKTVGEIRTGADVDWVPGEAVRFYAGAEYVRRLGNPEFVVSGTVPGLFDFSGLGSSQYDKRDWAQMRAGMEYGVGGGLLNLSLNGTTKGPAPTWWINVSYGMNL